MNDIFFHRAEDPEVVEAAQQARDTFRIFWREVTWERNRIVPGLSVAAIKAPFTDPDTDPNESDDPPVENMWISDVDFDGDVIKGTLINEPKWLKSIAVGDSVTFKLGRLMDWMYAIGDRVYGGFTVNAMRRQMNNADRRQHDAAWGLDFGDPENVLLVPPNYVGEKEPKKSWLSWLFPDSPATPQSLEQVTSIEHPMAVNCLSAMTEQMASDPEVASFVDDDGMTTLHRFALGGAGDVVKALLDHGADVNARAFNGMSALQMAQSLGWSDLAKTLREHGANDD